MLWRITAASAKPMACSWAHLPETAPMKHFVRQQTSAVAPAQQTATAMALPIVILARLKPLLYQLLQRLPLLQVQSALLLLQHPLRSKVLTVLPPFRQPGVLICYL